jgi:hypothetical protein
MLRLMDESTRPAAEEQLLRANRDFYRAFASADYVAMDRLWSEHAGSTCVHPGWEALRGRDRVMASWRGILRRPLPVRSRDEVATVLGEVGVIVCIEVLPEGELVATNVFVLEQGRWRMLHHQAGLVARSRERNEDEDSSDEDESEESGSGRLLN